MPTFAETAALLERLHGTDWLIASLLYGSGVRLGEACALRVKDLDLASRVLSVRDGKGRKDRVTMGPALSTRSTAGAAIGCIRETVVQRAVRASVLAAGIDKAPDLPQPAPRLRDHLLQAGHDIRTIQELLGHKDVSTTEIYTLSSTADPSPSTVPSTSTPPAPELYRPDPPR